MHDMTSENLRNAFAGESMAHVRYKIWGERAQQEGLPNVARMFRAIAYAEQVHGTNHFAALRELSGSACTSAAPPFGLAGTADNLQGGIDGETFEIEEMYPVYLEVARHQGEEAAITSFTYALQAEKIHARWYRRAHEAVTGGADVELDTVQICRVCGHTREGEAPDVCPICQSVADAFTAFPTDGYQIPMAIEHPDSPLG